MKVTKTVKETRDLIKNWKREGKTIGLVPTMGFLHEGHASLIKRCREENDIVVVSDFVNPTQFGPTEDLEAYPRDFKRDSELCESIRKMVQDLNFDIQIVGCPIIREEDGLAKSSRNTYLSEEERKAALCLSRAVKAGQNMICKGSKAEEVLTKMREIIEAEPLAKIDYVSMVDALDMQPVEIVEKDVLVAMAVYIGKTRLIDNFSYEV